MSLPFSFTVVQAPLILTSTCSNIKENTVSVWVIDLKLIWVCKVNISIDDILPTLNSKSFLDLILNVFSGLASPLHSSEPILSRFLNQKVAKGHSQNLDYAKSLLKKSGFYYKNDQLFDKYGNKVELELLTNAGNTQREAAGVSIKQDLEKLGIKINFKPIEFNSLVNKITNEVNFDCIILALTSNILEPNSGYNVWTPNGALHIFNKRTPNDLKSSDKVLDFEIELEEIFKKGALELDFNKRKKYYDRYQEIIAQQNPLVYLYAPLTIYAIRQKIKNIYPSVIGGIISDKSLIYIED